MSITLIISKHNYKYEVLVNDNTLQVKSIMSFEVDDEAICHAPTTLEAISKTKWMSHNSEEDNLSELILLYNALGYTISDSMSVPNTLNITNSSTEVNDVCKNIDIPSILYLVLK